MREDHITDVELEKIIGDLYIALYGDQQQFTFYLQSGTSQRLSHFQLFAIRRMEESYFRFGLNQTLNDLGVITIPSRIPRFLRASSRNTYFNFINWGLLVHSLSYLNFPLIPLGHINPSVIKDIPLELQESISLGGLDQNIDQVLNFIPRSVRVDYAYNVMRRYYNRMTTLALMAIIVQKISQKSTEQEEQIDNVTDALDTQILQTNEAIEALSTPEGQANSIIDSIIEEKILSGELVRDSIEEEEMRENLRSYFNL